MDNNETDNILPEDAIDEANASDDNAEQTDSKVKKSRTGSLLASIAIILSLAALAASGYLYLQQINAARQTVANIKNLETSLQTMQTDLENSQQRLQKNLERQHADIQTLNNTTAQFDSKVENTPQTWSVEEVNRLLQLAIDQLTLAANIDGALAALEIADRRLSENGDPELQPVRQKIASDIASLNQVQRIDLPGTIHRLHAVAQSIDHIPALGHSSSAVTTTVENLPVAADSVWQQIGQDLSGLVKIRRIDQPEIPLIPPDQILFLRENTKALLMTASMALLRNDNESYKSSLQQTQQWLVKYFNAGNQNAQWTIGEVQKLAAVNPSPQLPDISGSLSQLEAITEGKQR